MYTLDEAARVTGKSKPAITKAIKTGRLSATRGDDGSYRIDPSELARVYPVTGKVSGNGLRSDTPGDVGVPGRGLAGELANWRALAIKREGVIRDFARARCDAAREDLRREVEERREVQHKLTALLKHRQAGSVPSAGGPSLNGSPRPWWRRWFR